MEQTMEGTVSAQRRLVVMPIPVDVADADVLRAVHSFLVGHAGIPRCAAFVTWDEDANLVAQDIEPDLGDASADSLRSPLRSALSALLVELFGARVRTSWTESGETCTPEADVDELSLSFLLEVHDFVTRNTSFVALLTDRVDPGTIVRELRHIQGLRIIYCGVPPRWAENSV
jgi:hypothetical protein